MENEKPVVQTEDKQYVMTEEQRVFLEDLHLEQIEQM